MHQISSALNQDKNKSIVEGVGISVHKIAIIPYLPSSPQCPSSSYCSLSTAVGYFLSLMFSRRHDRIHHMLQGRGLLGPTARVVDRLSPVSVWVYSRSVLRLLRLERKLGPRNSHDRPSCLRGRLWFRHARSEWARCCVLCFPCVVLVHHSLVSASPVVEPAVFRPIGRQQLSWSTIKR